MCMKIRSTQKGSIVFFTRRATQIPSYFARCHTNARRHLKGEQEMTTNGQKMRREMQMTNEFKTWGKLCFGLLFGNASSARANVKRVGTSDMGKIGFDHLSSYESAILVSTNVVLSFCFLVRVT